MANQRSSLERRGLEVLFGEPPPLEIRPRGASLAVNATPSAQAEPPETTRRSAIKPLMAASSATAQELERALLREARAGASGSGKGVSLRLVDESLSPTPEMEQAFLAEAVGAEELLEKALGEQSLDPEKALYEPPPPDVSDLSDGVLPPRSQPIYIDRDEPFPGYSPQQGASSSEHLGPPARPPAREEQREMSEWVGEPRLRELDKEISETYDQVLVQVGGSGEIATECYDLLLKARDIVVRRDMAQISQAEYYVERVHARLKQSAQSEASVKKYAWWITAWGFLWGAVYLALLILLNHTWFKALLVPPSGSSIIADTEMFLRAMIWGGIGGVVAVLYGLFKHARLRDFDSQYNLSYVGKPFLGLVLGATVYMLLQLMLTLRLLPAALQVPQDAALAVTPWIVYPLAWAGGFKENCVLDLVDRTIKRIFPRGKGEAASSPDLGLEKG